MAPKAKAVTKAPAKKAAANGRTAAKPKAAPAGRTRTKARVAKAPAKAKAKKTRGSRPAPAKAGKAVKAARGAKALPKAKLKLEPVRGVKIKELNPQEKCGPGTSVLQLFRVDESLGKDLTTHLVFFDRHGWYCEHGRTCRAVADVHKLGKRRMVVGL